jgi:CubicO group peptidase (beta-lactamase class C family)
MTDWDAGLAWVENATPAWEPGTATGYHAVTYGWIVGGIIQHATGRHIRDVIAEDVAQPLGVADELFVGIPNGLEARLATLALTPAGEGLGLAADSDFHQAMPLGLWQHTNGMAFRQAVLPSANGHFTARALARVYAALAGDGSVDGVRLVQPGTIKHMQRVMTTDIDRVLGPGSTKGIGFFMGGEVNGVHGPMGPRGTAFGHPGAGGPIAYADPEAGLAVAVTSNKMAFPLPGEGVTLEITDLIRAEYGE